MVHAVLVMSMLLVAITIFQEAMVFLSSERAWFLGGFALRVLGGFALVAFIFLLIVGAGGISFYRQMFAESRHGIDA